MAAAADRLTAGTETPSNGVSVPGDYVEALRSIQPVRV